MTSARAWSALLIISRTCLWWGLDFAVCRRFCSQLSWREFLGGARVLGPGWGAENRASALCRWCGPVGFISLWPPTLAGLVHSRVWSGWDERLQIWGQVSPPFYNFGCLLTCYFSGTGNFYYPSSSCAVASIQSVSQLSLVPPGTRVFTSCICLSAELREH